MDYPRYSSSESDDDDNVGKDMIASGDYTPGGPNPPNDSAMITSGNYTPGGPNDSVISGNNTPGGSSPNLLNNNNNNNSPNANSQPKEYTNDAHAELVNEHEGMEWKKQHDVAAMDEVYDGIKIATVSEANLEKLLVKVANIVKKGKDEIRNNERGITLTPAIQTSITDILDGLLTCTNSELVIGSSRSRKSIMLD